MVPLSIYADDWGAANPGNGYYRLYGTKAITSLTISQPDPAVLLAGTLTFTVGSNTASLDLATDRYLGLSGALPWLDVTIAGVDPAALFSIVLR